MFQQMYTFVLSIVLVALSANVAAAPDLKTIMQNPDWIGPPVEAAWWQQDGSYIYRVKRAGTTVRDLYRMTGAGVVEPVTPEEYAGIEGPAPTVSDNGQRILSIVGGDLVLRDRTTGELRRLYTGTRPVTSAHFEVGDEAVYFETDSTWWRVGLDAGVAYPVTDLRFEDAPADIDSTALGAEQLRLFSTLSRLQQEQRDKQLTQEMIASAAPEVGAAPWYLGKGQVMADSALSADGRWLLLVLESDKGQGGPADKMPHYVTRSGYVEIEDVRRLVGREAPQPQSLELLDLKNRQRFPLDLSGLSGRHKDPLAKLKSAQDIAPYSRDNPRPVTVSNMVWHPQSATVAVQLLAGDYKDRWTVRINAPSQAVDEVYRLTDPAWINWDFNKMGWVPQSDSLWLLSEASGYAHLCTITAKGRVRQITSGDFELRQPVWSPSGDRVYALSNRRHPTEWDLFAIDPERGEMHGLTHLKGVEDFALNQQADSALIRYSSPYVPLQAAVVAFDDGELTAQTNTLTNDYSELQWQFPEYVAIPSAHGSRPIWSKFYPADPTFEGPRPAVMFVHGAGYTQNTDYKFPYYFREQMFHNLLTSRGYHVLDMDYRGSEGYGRDWRTAIYRQMGTPELEDYVDGAQWLVRNHGVDPKRVGIYGGSYGGFMTFMALFKEPDVFAAGAALRPVTDWRHYNHGYTAHILNTPDVDPEAHRRSSPIEYVEGLKGDLLISHGMLDDNVFYKDSVRLVQRLIELEKEDWELASYPLEPHGYIHPESWLDQYRRILSLFEESIGSPSQTQ